ncbi:hypothetical protein OH77DRAFT_1247420 [Trametes cingulata]|nr:hypothetical protein OH77DRAFT_1247420 [Trametes cingulata]
MRGWNRLVSASLQPPPLVLSFVPSGPGLVNMSSTPTTPTLFGVLVVLNIILAVVWIPVLEAVDDATLVFRAMSFVNAFAAAWWIWINTSLRRRVRTVSRHATSCTRSLVSLLPPVLVVPLRLLRSVIAPLCNLNLPSWSPSKWPQTHTMIRDPLRLLQLRAPRLLDRRRDRSSRPYLEPEWVTTILSILDSPRRYLTERGPRIPSRSFSPSPPTRCSSIDTLVDDESSDTSKPPEGTHIATSTPTSDKKNSPNASLPVTTLVRHPYRVRHSTPSSVHSVSTYSSAGNLSPHNNMTIPDLPPSLASLCDTQFLEAVQFYRDVRTLTRERDMYRTRAYQLAMRLDDYYTAHAQDALDLERTKGEVEEARRALDVLEAERRDLSVALASILIACRSATNAELPVAKAPVEGSQSLKQMPSTEELVVYPRTPGGDCSSVDSDERPLLLMATTETFEDTPTRSRTTLRTSAKPAKSHLEDIVLETQRLSEHVRSQGKGESAIWDAQRVNTARPLFSVVHEEAAGDRSGLESSIPAQVEPSTEADRIIEDLRLSRAPCATPRRAIPMVLEKVEEEEEAEGKEEKSEEEEGEEDEGEDDVEDAVEEDEDSEESGCEDDSDVEEPKLEETSIQVQITRQPRGPPPSPFATKAEKASGHGGQKGKEHTWRGRSRPTNDAVPTLPTASPLEPTSAESGSSQLYPESRLPNRVRTRQATAPATPMTPSPTATMGKGERGPAAPLTGTIGEERRRHATFSGAGPSVSSGAQQGGRWPMSAFGNGGVERVRGPAQPYPFVPSNLFYQRTGGWPMK